MIREVQPCSDISLIALYRIRGFYASCRLLMSVCSHGDIYADIRTDLPSHILMGIML